MATNRMIAHYAHETELDAVTQILGRPQMETESYVVYDEPDDATVKQIEDAGLVVEIVEDPALSFRRFDTFGIDAVARTSAPMGAGTDAGIDTGSLAVAEPDEPAYYMVTLSFPLSDDLRQRIESFGVNLLRFSPPASYSAHLTPAQVADLRGIPEVAVVRPYVDLDTGVDFESLPPVVKAAAPATTSSYEILPDRREDFAAVIDFLTANAVDYELKGRVIHMTVPAGSSIPDQVRQLAGEPFVGPIEPLFDLRLHQSVDLHNVLQWLASENIAVVGSSPRKIRIRLDGDDGSLYERLRQHDSVADIDPFIPPHVDNDLARQALGIEVMNGSALTPVLTQDGSGEIVGVADTGIDATHPDLAPRLIVAIPRGRPGNASDPHGHGTHVTGSIVGEDALGRGVKGIAPNARVVVQSLLDANNRLGGLPLDLNDLFAEAYAQGVRIHNNSWGSATGSEYVVNSEEVDEFVWNHPDMLVVISAGNEGTAANPSHGMAGFVDLFSIGAPATAKNALTVGASRSNRTNGGYSQLTYGQAWGAHFPQPPIHAENVSGNPECIAGFSSRGPCTDNRIKPDLVAPGTDILSTKSSTAPNKRFWGLDATDPVHYAYMGGTSMAAPIVAGCAALARQYYREQRTHQPSAALLKATLINSTRWLTGPDAIANHQKSPNYHQGFGIVSMQHAIPNPAVDFQLDFIDGWQMPAEVFRATGERRRYVVTADRPGELRVCLSWTDPPARAIQNVLHLTVQNLQNAKKFLGNEDRAKLLNGMDRDNNVQVVRIPNVQAGERYMIMVTNTSLLRTPQPFALAVTSPSSAPMQRMP
jgi:serine protease AprX